MFKFSIIRKLNTVKEVTSLQFYVNSMYLKKKNPNRVLVLATILDTIHNSKIYI